MKTIISVAIISTLTALSSAGSLTPPGAPAPTMKPLSDVEPRTPIRASQIPLTISQPGSYYLAESIQSTSSTGGILITTDSVTLDLNGYSLKGTGTGAQANAGVQAGACNDIVVKNGEITNWRGSGVSVTGERSLIENINSHHNKSMGIYFRSGKILNCTTDYNASGGIVQVSSQAPLSGSHIISGCTAANNTNSGISVRQTGCITNCTAYNNTSYGIYVDGPGVLVQDNTCTSNSEGMGIIGDGCTVINNVCTSNTQRGIIVSGDQCRIESNHVTNNTLGMSITGRSLAIKNTASGNTNSGFFFYDPSRYGKIIGLVEGETASENPLANFQY